MPLANVPDILKYGALGLGFLLAFLAYMLLVREQTREQPRLSIIRAVYVFMSFSVVLAAMGFVSEMLSRCPGIDSTPRKYITVALLDARPTQTNLGDASASRQEIENILTNSVRQRLESACFKPLPDRELYGTVNALIYHDSHGYANNVSVRETNFNQQQQNCTNDVFRGSMFPEPSAPAAGEKLSPLDNEYWISARINVRP